MNDENRKEQENARLLLRRVLQFCTRYIRQGHLHPFYVAAVYAWMAEARGEALERKFGPKAPAVRQLLTEAEDFFREHDLDPSLINFGRLRLPRFRAEEEQDIYPWLTRLLLEEGDTDPRFILERCVDTEDPLWQLFTVGRRLKVIELCAEEMRRCLREEIPFSIPELLDRMELRADAEASAEEDGWEEGGSLLYTPVEDPPEQIPGLQREGDLPARTAASGQEETRQDFGTVMERYRQLQERLQETVRGQEPAIGEFVRGIFRGDLQSRASERRRPKAVFLFAGPPGVGKSLLARTAAGCLGLPFHVYNMGEYTASQSHEGLIGVSSFYKNASEGQLVGFVREHPDCLLIFDEIEKAHRNVIRLFLQMLDQGSMENAFRGDLTDFSRAVIIFTTNAGRALYEDTEKKLSEIPRQVLLDALTREKDPATKEPVFPAEICSRLSAGSLILFDRLEMAWLEEIAGAVLTDSASQLEEEYGWKIRLDPRLPRLLLLLQGGGADARTVTGQSSRFLADLLFDLAGQPEAEQLTDGIEVLSVEVCPEDPETEEELRKLLLDETGSLRLRPGYAARMQADYSREDDTLRIRCGKIRRTQILGAEDAEHLLADEERPKERFADVIGAEDAKAELQYFAEMLSNPRLSGEEGGRLPKGILLYGPPGTGKTMLARAMAGEADAAFLQLNAAEFLDSKVGQSEENVRDLFRRARSHAPAIIFIDEIDAVGKLRTGDSETRESVLNTLLTEMDGFRQDAARPVFVLAATNYAIAGEGSRVLDPALVRRFDNRIFVDLPKEEERRLYLIRTMKALHFRGDAEMAAAEAAVRTSGSSLAELGHAVDLAARTAAREGREPESRDLREALESYQYGARIERTARFERQTAVHESGHAYLAWLAGEKPAYMSVDSRGSSGGYLQTAEENVPMYTRESLLWKIRCALAGRAAEEILCGPGGSINTGAAGDMQTATQIALKMLCEYGMMEGQMTALPAEMLLQSPLAASYLEQANRLLAEEMETTKALLQEGSGKVRLLAERLLAERNLTGEEIREILA